MKLDFHKNHKLLYGTIFWGFLFLSIIIAVLPALWVQEKTKPQPWTEPMTNMEKLGLKVYVSEGCMYCHTQQVRPLEMDEIWGRPSVPADYAQISRTSIWQQTPAVLGSSRTGPDLSNIGVRQPSAIWQYMHLYNPRSVVKESIMPSFPWLFEVVKNPAPDDKVIPVPEGFAPKNGKVIATKRAKALVAYLLSLKQEPLTPPESFQPKSKTKTASVKKPDAVEKAVDGALIYANHCSACHQSNGQGIAGVFPPLAGDPVVTSQDPTDHIRTVLYGLQGKTINGTMYYGIMQPFGEVLSDEEVAAVINHERTSWGSNAPTITAEDVAKVRNNPELGKIQTK
ncbi:MAG TPA: cbb3-type cytochrome c oxidase subunit II [Balneolaceae bacterium]|nr:cbb3-type cytochrome c oxidase subunit II [Balneolaceae bacterium]